MQNYLRTHRKRLGLSQAEVAFVLGVKCGSKVSRYEKLKRLPVLETVIALEVLFGTTAKELFTGLYQDVALRTRARVQALSARLLRTKQSRLRDHKLKHLGRVTGRKD